MEYPEDDLLKTLREMEAYAQDNYAKGGDWRHLHNADNIRRAIACIAGPVESYKTPLTHRPGYCPLCYTQHPI